MEITTQTKRNLLWVGLQTVLASVVGTLAVRAVALAVLGIPPEFPPLAGPGPTIFLTVVGVGVGVGVRGGPRNSDRLLRWDPDHREGVWNVPKETELPG